MLRASVVKLELTHLVRSVIFRYFRHYAWPRRLLNRMYDYDDSYNHEELLVNVGAGPYFKRKGWLSADYLPGHIGDNEKFHLDLTQSFEKMPFDNVQAYYMSHVLEHFKYEDGSRLLKSIWKSMKTGGTLRIVVPDADLILDRARENDLDYFRPLLSFFKNNNASEISCAEHALNLLSQPRCLYSNSGAVKENVDTVSFSDRLKNDTNDEIIQYLNDHDYKQNDRGSLHLAAYNEHNLTQIMLDAGFKTCYKSAFMQSKFAKMREAPIFDSTHPWLSLYIEAVK